MYENLPGNGMSASSHAITRQFKISFSCSLSILFSQKLPEFFPQDSDSFAVQVYEWSGQKFWRTHHDLELDCILFWFWNDKKICFLVSKFCMTYVAACKSTASERNRHSSSSFYGIANKFIVCKSRSPHQQFPNIKHECFCLCRNTF